MKKILIFILCLFCLMGCNISPNITTIEDNTRNAVEELLTEDNNDEKYIRLDRYFLSEQTDDLTYVGTLKATIFFTHIQPKWNKSYTDFDMIKNIDSVKVYRNVSIKFRDKKYDFYTITINKDE